MSNLITLFLANVNQSLATYIFPKNLEKWKIQKKIYYDFVFKYHYNLISLLLRSKNEKN